MSLVGDERVKVERANSVLVQLSLSTFSVNRRERRHECQWM